MTVLKRREQKNIVSVVDAGRESTSSRRGVYCACIFKAPSSFSPTRAEEGWRKSTESLILLSTALISLTHAAQPHSTHTHKHKNAGTVPPIMGQIRQLLKRDMLERLLRCCKKAAHWLLDPATDVRVIFYVLYEPRARAATPLNNAVTLLNNDQSSEGTPISDQHVATVWLIIDIFKSCVSEYRTPGHRPQEDESYLDW